MHAVQSISTTSPMAPRVQAAADEGTSWLARSAGRVWRALEAVGQWRARRELLVAAERYPRSDPGVAAMLRAATDELRSR